MGSGQRLHPESLFVIDDSLWDGGWKGKGALSIPYLLGRDWKILTAGYQIVLSRSADRTVGAWA